MRSRRRGGIPCPRHHLRLSIFRSMRSAPRKEPRRCLHNYFQPALPGSDRTLSVQTLRSSSSSRAMIRPRLSDGYDSWRVRLRLAHIYAGLTPGDVSIDLWPLWQALARPERVLYHVAVVRARTICESENEPVTSEVYWGLVFLWCQRQNDPRRDVPICLGLHLTG